ncbi:MAG: putative drug exporter of the superfamily, partial [Gaiellales bacterium]|nr:putative drug exporter of the superfamily [Gaiellales bacterium]
LLATAILTDALIMRLTVVPSLLSLLGEKSWAMPRWLDKILPNITIEPPSERERELPVRGRVESERELEPS